MSFTATNQKSVGSIRRAAVIGSGVMGAGIAAHLANAGLQVTLLDVVPSVLTVEEEKRGLSLANAVVRNRLALAAIDRMKRSKPAQLYDAAWVSRITAGNLNDDQIVLGDVDWIIEAVVERLEIKQEVLATIEAARRSGTLISTNTSGLSVEAMTEGRSVEFREHFAATHFFNPPRYMKLVEIVPTSDTRPAVVQLLTELCEKKLGKGVVLARDTPNFIANRIGTFGMLVTLNAAIQYGLTVDEADALTGVAMGRPKTATFRMLDLVGLDTLLHVVDNVRNRSDDEAEREVFTRPAIMQQLIETGRLGEKSGGGFYRKLKGGDGRSRIETLSLDTLEYGTAQIGASSVLDAAKAAKGTAAKVKALLFSKTEDRFAQFAWQTLKQTLLYSASLVGVIAGSISDIDRAMRWGFNWELGPFELWDAIGLKKSVELMEAEGEQIPLWIREWLADGHEQFYKSKEDKRFYVHIDGEYQEEQQEEDVISLQALKATGKTVFSTTGASLIDLGDDVACLEFHSPNNAIGGEILAAIRQSTTEVSRNWRGLVLANEGRNFCVGANLVLLLMEAQNVDWDEVEEIIRLFQDSMQRLKLLDRPIVAAPHRMTLGGGVEACLTADQIIYSPETYYGLVETGVGLIPAGGGCKEAAALAASRAAVAGNPSSGKPFGDLQTHLNGLFETIALAKASTSGHEVRGLGYMRPQDRVIMNQENRIAEAKRAVLELDRIGYSPPEEQRIRVAGREGKAVLQLGAHAMWLGGHISDHDAVIAAKLGHVLAGGDVRQNSEVSEQYLLDLECEAFLSLLGERKTQERISHMLATGKPLRN